MPNVADVRLIAPVAGRPDTYCPVSMGFLRIDGARVFLSRTVGATTTARRTRLPVVVVEPAA